MSESLTASNPASIDLSTHPVWSRLTEKQQSFCRVYLELGDAVEAVKRTHDVKSHRAAEAVAGRLLRDWRIRKVLSIAGHTVDGTLVSKSELLQLISDRLRDPKTETSAFAKLTTSYTDLIGWQKPTPKPEPTGENDFDRILEMERQRKHASKENSDR